MELEALKELHDRVKAGDCSNDGIMYRVFGEHWKDCFDAYNGSLHAAKALHDAVLPGVGWEVYQTSRYPGMIPGSCPSPFKAIIGWGTQVSGHANTPARAWLLAILRALISQAQNTTEGDAT